MKLSTRTLDGIAIVSVAGAVESHTAGELLDALVQCLGEGHTKLVVDLSGVHTMTRAGVRGIVVAAKLIEPGRGDLRVCGARPSTEALLQGLGFHHLVKCDPTLQSSMARLRDAKDRDAETLAAIVPFAASAPTRPLETVSAGAGAPLVWRRKA